MEKKLIKSAFITKCLLQLGYKIIDIAPHKYNKDRTVFIFKVENEFYTDLEKIERSIKDGKANQNQTNYRPKKL